MRKPKLKIDDQIKKMKRKGIHFNTINSKSAYSIIRENTYLYKIFYYRKIFSKNEQNQYGIEFAYLTDLSSIDMKLRYTLLHMCLDIEHSIKTLLNDIITEDPTEDGYNVITDFINNTDVTKDDIFRNKMSGNRVYREYQSQYNNPSYWVCFEIMSYRVFVQFVEYYYEKTRNHKLKFASDHLRYVKNIRNTCAHNSVLIVPLIRTRKLSSGLLSHFHDKDVFMTGDHSKAFLDIAAVLAVHEKYCSGGIKKYRKNDLMDLKSRVNRNSNYYTKHSDIKFFFNKMNLLIDNYN